MTFFICHDTKVGEPDKECLPIGMFVHVPKCGGSATQQALAGAGLRLVRPFSSMNHHRSLSESLTYICRLPVRDSQADSFFVIIPWRRPVEWRLSIFNYAVRQSPDISFMPFENHLFSGILFEEYIEMLLCKAEKGVGSGSLLSRSELAWHPLWSWMTVTCKQLSVLPQNTDIFFINSSYNVFDSCKSILDSLGIKTLSSSGSSAIATESRINQFSTPREHADTLSSLSRRMTRDLTVFDMGRLIDRLSLSGPIAHYNAVDLVGLMDF